MADLKDSSSNWLTPLFVAWIQHSVMSVLHIILQNHRI